MRILDQALINLIINQIAIIETHQELAHQAKKNDLHNNIDSLGTIINIISASNDLKLSDVDSNAIAEHIAWVKTKNLLNKALNKENEQCSEN